MAPINVGHVALGGCHVLVPAPCCIHSLLEQRRQTGEGVSVAEGAIRGRRELDLGDEESDHPKGRKS